MKSVTRIILLSLLVFMNAVLPSSPASAAGLLPAGYVSIDEWAPAVNGNWHGEPGMVRGIYVAPDTFSSGFMSYDAEDEMYVEQSEGFKPPTISNTSPFEFRWDRGAVGSLSLSGGKKYSNQKNDISWDNDSYSLDYSYQITVSDLQYRDGEIISRMSGTEQYTSRIDRESGKVRSRKGAAALQADENKGMLATCRSFREGEEDQKNVWYLILESKEDVTNNYAENSTDWANLYFRILAVLPYDGDAAASTGSQTSAYPEGYNVNEKEGTATVDTDAANEAGEDTFEIPPAVVATLIGLLGGGAGIGIGIGKKKKRKPEKKKSSDNRKKDKKSDKDKDKKEESKSTYAMRIRKDFGDTLLPGESQRVYARMVEITPDGAVKTDLSLTRQIVISSPDGLTISGVSMSGEYISAFVTAPEAVSGQAKAAVTFDLAGTFVLHMHFKLEHEEVQFFQENLTLPAFYENETRLPFYISASKDAEVTAVIKPAGSYTVKVEPGENDNLMDAVITETSTKKHEPGTVEQFLLEVYVRHGLKEEALGSLPVYRFHMGFKVKMDSSIGCHFELKDEVWMSGVGGKRFHDAKDYRPARTQVEMAVYDWDEDAHEVLVAAVIPKSYTFTALEEENQDKITKMDIDLQISGNPTEKGRQGVFVCTKGLLDPPTRFKAKLNMTAEFNGKSYTFEKEVVMASQKWRLSSEIVENAERDQQLTRQLTHLRDSIENSSDLPHLFPLVKYIDIMLKGYSELYGYDERQVERVKDVYTRYMNGELLGANAEAQVITFADELGMFVSALIDTGAQAEDSLGFWGNLAIGVLSLGYSDAIFTTFKAAKSMKQYVEHGGDSIWGAFYVGASRAVGEFALNKVSEIALSSALKGTKIAGELAKELSPNSLGKAVVATEQAVKKTKDFLSEKVGKKIKNVLERSKNEKKNVKNRVKNDIIESNKKPMSAEEIRLEKLESNGNKAAKVKLDDLEAARQVAETWPTTENLEFYRKKVLAVQQDKSAMYQLKTMAGGDDLRASFNREMKSIYDNTDQRVRQYFEKKGQPLKKKVQSATNTKTDALKKGQTVTMDRDVTYYAEDGGLLKQKEAQEAYEKMFYKETMGVDPPSSEAAHNWAKLNDQSVVQKASPEHYGNQHDLDAMLTNFDEKLIDPNKVGDVVKNKGLEWMKDGQNLIDQGYRLSDREMGDKLITEGMKLRKEGMRQITKQYAYIDARDISRACESGKIHISENLRYGVEMFNNTLTDGPTHISVAKCESLLRAKGLTLEGVAEVLGEITKVIG